MLGREAYHNPYLLAAVDSQLFGSEAPPLSRSEALLRLRPYIERHQAEGGAMHHVTRHILGLAQGFPAPGDSASCSRWTCTRPPIRCGFSTRRWNSGGAIAPIEPRLRLG